MTKDIAKCWTFDSSSSNKSYQMLQYVDGSTSCDCPGWTRHAQRVCKHTRAVDMGTADDICKASHDYKNVAPATKAMPTKAVPQYTVATVKRKVSW
jgi:hypothetical protein